MSFLIVMYLFCLAALAVGTFTDIKTREVPDWVNYSLIFAAFGARIIYSDGMHDYYILLSGIIGFLIFMGLAYLMFYTGQWGGGDAKMIMGLGAFIGLEISQIFHQSLLAIFNMPLISFFTNIIFVGAFYGLLWSFVISIWKRKIFLPEFNKIITKEKKTKLTVMIVSFIIIIAGAISYFSDKMISSILIIIGIMPIAAFYMYVYVKAIENSCMIRSVEPKELTEGDWIVEDIIVKGKRICGPKDLGIEKKQIQKLIGLYSKKMVGKIKVKDGIPFVPSFLAAFIITMIYGNIIFLIV